MKFSEKAGWCSLAVIGIVTILTVITRRPILFELFVPPALIIGMICSYFVVRKSRKENVDNVPEK